MKPGWKTAYYCAGLRMRDAESPDPVCGDAYAKRFMHDEALGILDRFKVLTGPNTSNLFRHRIIEDRLRNILLSDPDTTIVLMGSGFDSRAYRLSGGTWIELDHPEVINFKNERLPVGECKNRLVRIPIQFALESLRDVLSPFKKNDSVVVVAEGVLFYMDREAKEALIKTLKALFPNHLLIGDLFNRKFLKKYATPLHKALQEMGAHFQDVVDAPEELFLEAGYRLREKISIVGSAVKAGRLRRGPRFLFPLFRTAINGFAIHVFEYESDHRRPSI